MRHKYINRPNDVHNPSWQVRIGEVENGVHVYGSKETVNKLFSDGVYGSKQKAFNAAVKWRDAYLKKNNGMHLLKNSAKLDAPMQSSRRNTSGVIGVALAIDEKGDNIYYGYKAMWSTTIMGKRCQRTKRFACDLHGDCEAFRMACDIRHEHCGTIIITDRAEIPCLPDVEYEIKA